MKLFFKIIGNIFLIMFIISLLGVATSMLFKKEGIAERLGNIAYLSLLLAALIKIIFYEK